MAITGQTNNLYNSPLATKVSASIYLPHTNKRNLPVQYQQAWSKSNVTRWIGIQKYLNLILKPPLVKWRRKFKSICSFQKPTPRNALQAEKKNNPSSFKDSNNESKENWGCNPEWLDWWFQVLIVAISASKRQTMRERKVCIFGLKRMMQNSKT